MQHRIFHKILVSVLAICIIAPFFVSNIYADTLNSNFSLTVSHYVDRVYNGSNQSPYAQHMTTTIEFKTPFTGTFTITQNKSGNNYITPVYSQQISNITGALMTSINTSDSSKYVYTLTCNDATTVTIDTNYEITTSTYYGIGTITGSANGTYRNADIYTYIDGIESTLNDIADSIEYFDSIPIYSYQAYKLFSGIGTLIDYSYIGSDAYQFMHKAIKFKSIADSPYSTSRVFEIKSGKTLHVIGFFSHNITSQTIRLIDGSGNIYNLSPNTLSNINDMRLIDFTYTNNTNSSIIPCLQPANDSLAEVIPIYVGFNVPATLGSDLGIDFTDSYIKSIFQSSNSIVNAINSLKNGDSNTQNIVNEVNSQNEQLDQSINEYDQFESDFKSHFSNNMTQIQKPGIDNILSAATWYTAQLTALFNASGDFKIMFTLPLVLGLALFFIGRGALAYRESRTDVIESRTYDHELSDGSHYFKTYRQKRWK